MKKNLILLILAVFVPPLLLTSYFTPGDEYIVIGWNDLGMHCSNKDFDSIVILPPYNNYRAQVIKVGDENNNPEIISSGVTIDYEIPGNSYSVGKTNFWSYEDQLFGVNLPDNVGLTGAGLTGSMAAASDHYWVDGVPITPYTDDDLDNEDPFQLAKLDVYDANNILLATTQNVMPVSNEIGCVSSGCHSSQQDILDEHEDEGGFNPNNTPILCSSCHADVALGMPGNPDLESLSYVVHEKHKSKTNDCYKCHPGENTQCFRGVMHDGGMYCTDCHGNMEQVAHSISEGRRPWLDEPSCGATSCHGSNYAEEPGKLFKDSKGHGGLYCSACHGSTHAILPSTQARDNVQNIALQGYAGTLGDCVTCHGYVPDGPGPHGISGPQSSAESAFWPMDEGVGTTTEDISTNSNDGTLKNGPNWVVGKIVNALQFDGINDRVDCGNNNSMDIGSNDFSISMWVKMGTSQNTYPTLISKGGGSNSDEGYWLMFKNKRLRFLLSDGSTRQTFISNLIELDDNNWHHIALTIDRDMVLTFYFDGATSGYSDVSSFSEKDINSGRNLTIASWQSSSSTYLSGVIDEVRLYPSALSSDQVNVLANENSGGNQSPIISVAASADPETVTLPNSCNVSVTAFDPDGDDLTYSWSKLSGSGGVSFSPNSTTSSNNSTASFSSSGEYTLQVEVSDGELTVFSDVTVNVLESGSAIPVAFWPADEGAGTTLGDNSPNNNDGSLLNGTSWASGISSYALQFDGVNDKVDCGVGTTLNMNSSDFSVSLWLKMSEDQNTYPTLLAKGGGSNTDEGYWLMVKNDRMRFIFSNGTSKLSTYSGVVNLTDDNWHHVAVSLNRDGNISFYVDGINHGNTDISSFNGEEINSSRHFTIGSWGSGTASYFKGALDDIRLYDIALSETEVNELYDLYSAYKTTQATLNQSLSVSTLRAFPNPFKQQLTLEFMLEREQQINLSIYNLHGEIIQQLQDKVLGAGVHKFNVNLSNNNKVPQGMYIARLITEDYVDQEIVLHIE